MLVDIRSAVDERVRGRSAEQVVLLCFLLSIAGSPILSRQASAPTELSRWSGSDPLSFHVKVGRRWGKFVSG